MKDKRIWIVIICIFVIGSGLTKYTHSYVSSRSSGAAQADAAVIQESAAFDGPEASLQAGARLGSPEGEISAAEESAASFSGETGPSPSDSPSAFEEGAPDAEAASAAEETAAAARAALVEGEGMADAGAAAAGGSAAAGQVPISPLIGARPAETTGGSSVDYIQRLKDLDAQIARIQNEEQEANVYSIITSAESELKMWESELSAIYSALLGILSQEDARQLAQEQQEWSQSREARAAEQSGQSSVDGLGYAAALVSLTRERAYELAARYEETA